MAIEVSVPTHTTPPACREVQVAGVAVPKPKPTKKPQPAASKSSSKSGSSG